MTQTRRTEPPPQPGDRPADVPRPILTDERVPGGGTPRSGWVFSVDDFLKMGEAGLFGDQKRLELWSGTIVHMSPIGPGHIGRSNKLANGPFGSLFAQGRAVVQVQSPLRLDAHHAPQPDLLLLKWREDCYTDGLPRPEDVLLLVEVADTSAELDRGEKLAAYAGANIGEYWILEQPAGVLTVCRDPRPTQRRYGRVIDHREGTVTPQALPDVPVDVAWLLA